MIVTAGNKYLTSLQKLRSTDFPSLRTQSSMRVFKPLPHTALSLSWQVLQSAWTWVPTDQHNSNHVLVIVLYITELFATNLWCCRSSESSSCSACMAPPLLLEDRSSLSLVFGLDKQPFRVSCSHYTAEKQRKKFWLLDIMSKTLFHYLLSPDQCPDHFLANHWSLTWKAVWWFNLI